MEKNFEDLNLAYKECISSNCQSTPVWRKPEYVVSSWLLFFLVGYLVRGGH